MMRAALFAALLVGCSYPEFSFAPPPPADAESLDSADLDAGGELDTAVLRDEGLEVQGDGCACGAGETCVDGACKLEPSCKSIKAKFPTLMSGPFMIDPDGGGPLAPFRVYCEMTADGGGWTLALKADGAKTTFAYDSALWTNSELLNTASTDLSTAEAKFRSYTEMAFTALRLRMFDGSTPRFFVTTMSGTSLRALFAGPPVTTTIGRTRWLTLVPDPSLQDNCNREGVNQEVTGGNALRVRFGILGNNETNCDSPNSFVGFGASMGDVSICYGGTDPGVVVGNAARAACGAAKDKSTRTVGFLFVR